MVCAEESGKWSRHEYEMYSRELEQARAGPVRPGLMLSLICLSLTVQLIGFTLYLAGHLPRSAGVGVGFATISVDLYALWIWINAARMNY